MLAPLLSLLSPAGGRGRLSVLIFHRVLPQRDELFPDEVDAVAFDAVCGWAASLFNVLPLGEAVPRLRQGRLPARALAITFDDGYRDNHGVALPILRRHGLPATFFVATGFLDGGRMFNDTVIEAVRRSPLAQVDLRPLGLDAAEGLADLRTPAQRRALIETLLRAIKYRDPAERVELGAQLAELLHSAAPDDLMMRSAQVRELRAAGMEVGAHTVNHPILARLAADEARSEIRRSKDALEDLLDERVNLFAYPNGKPVQDYSDETVALVREAGFDCAFTTAWGAARGADDPFRLPRFSPWERTRHRFALRMAHNLVRRPANNCARAAAS